MVGKITTSTIEEFVDNLPSSFYTVADLIDNGNSKFELHITYNYARHDNEKAYDIIPDVTRLIVSNEIMIVKFKSAFEGREYFRIINLSNVRWYELRSLG